MNSIVITIICICIYLMIGFAFDYLADMVVSNEDQDEGTDVVIILFWPIIVIGAIIETIKKGG